MLLVDLSVIDCWIEKWSNSLFISSLCLKSNQNEKEKYLQEIWNTSWFTKKLQKGWRFYLFSFQVIDKRESYRSSTSKNNNPKHCYSEKHFSGEIGCSAVCRRSVSSQQCLLQIHLVDRSRRYQGWCGQVQSNSSLCWGQES